MSKKTIFTITILIVTVSFLGMKILGNSEKEKNSSVLSSSVSSNTQDSINKSSPTIIPPVSAIPVDKIEVVHFHGTHQCWSCITVGEYALKTIKEKFPEEYQSGKIVFKDINGELKENKQIVVKYQARGSSLFINAIRNTQDNIQEEIKVWYLVNDKEQFMQYFEGRLKDLLGT